MTNHSDCCTCSRGFGDTESYYNFRNMVYALPRVMLKWGPIRIAAIKTTKLISGVPQ